MRKVILSIVLLTVTCICFAQTYLAYNIWIEKPDIIFSCNYKRGTMVPAGTLVDRIEIKTDNKTRMYLAFNTPEYEKSFKVYIQSRVQGEDFTLDDLKARMFTDKDFKALTADFTEMEVDAIVKGVICQGMSKEAVLVSWGYPPNRSTFSTKLNNWIYPMNRWKTSEIVFNKDGRTISGAEIN